MQPGRPCLVCSHPEREAIEQDLANGFGYSRVSRDWSALYPARSMGRDALRRHLLDHAPEDIRASVLSAPDGIAAASLATRLLDIADDARRARLQARNDNKPMVLARLASVEAQVIVLLADRLGVSNAAVLRDRELANSIIDAVRMLTPEEGEPLALAIEATRNHELADDARRAFAHNDHQQGAIAP